jgi:hypothetical protein
MRSRASSSRDFRADFGANSSFSRDLCFMFSENFMLFKRVDLTSYLPAIAVNLREASSGLVLSETQKSELDKQVKTYN